MEIRTSLQGLTLDDLITDEVLYKLSIIIIDNWKSKGLIDDDDYSRMLNFIVKQKMTKTVWSVKNMTDIKEITIPETITISFMNCPQSIGITLSQGDSEYAIGLDYSLRNNPKEVIQVLLHELGHIYTNSFYSRNSDVSEIKRCETLADEWTKERKKELMLDVVNEFMQGVSV